MTAKPRLRPCVERWPGCETGAYHPDCCRFPKPCSCTIYDPERVTPHDLEASVANSNKTPAGLGVSADAPTPLAPSDWIAERRRLIDAATEGLWCSTPVRGGSYKGLSVEPYGDQIFIEEYGITYAANDADAELIVDARESLPKALNALEAVLEIHTPWDTPTSTHYYCEPSECDQAGEGGLRAECEKCRDWWPCETVKAVTEALGVEP